MVLRAFKLRTIVVTKSLNVAYSVVEEHRAVANYEL